MKLFSMALGLTTIFLVGSANAAIVCEGSTAMGMIRVTLQGDNVKVEGGALSAPAVFEKVDRVYDGHETMLVTAPGFAMRYANEYGCIKNAEIITNLRTENGNVGFIGSFKAPSCKGGSTSDELCHAN